MPENSTNNEKVKEQKVWYWSVLKTEGWHVKKSFDMNVEGYVGLGLRKDGMLA